MNNKNDDKNSAQNKLDGDALKLLINILLEDKSKRLIAEAYEKYNNKFIKKGCEAEKMKNIIYFYMAQIALLKAIMKLNDIKFNINNKRHKEWFTVMQNEAGAMEEYESKGQRHNVSDFDDINIKFKQHIESIFENIKNKSILTPVIIEELSIFFNKDANDNFIFDNEYFIMNQLENEEEYYYEDDGYNDDFYNGDDNEKLLKYID